MNQDEQIQEVQEVQEKQTPSLITDNYAPEPEVQADEVETPEVPETPEQPTVPAAPATPPPAPVQRVEDPGEFKPKDYSFDVQLADGSKVKISSPEDFANIPKDADFGDPKNFMDIQAKYNQMLNGMESDKKTYEEAKTAYEQQAAIDKEIDDYVASVENSFAYLEQSGKLPNLPPQYNDVTKWADPEVAKQPGVKERLELIEFIKTENAARTSLGLPRVTGLEAYTELRNRRLEEQATQREQKQVELRKQRGGMVGAPSAPAPGNANSDMIVGAGGSLRDI